MKKEISFVFFLFFFIFFIFFDAYAASPTTEELMKEIEALKSRVTELEQKLAEKEPEKAKREESALKEVAKHVGPVDIEKVLHGPERFEAEYRLGEGQEAKEAVLSLGADATFVLQGTPNANNAGSGENSICNASWSTDIEIQKVFNDWGMAFMHLEPGLGATIEPELKVFSNVNRDANETGGSPDISEVWYEHYFFDKNIAITFGKLDFTIYFDQNEYANDETTQFLGRIFRNSPSIEFPPDNTLGLQAYVGIPQVNFLEFNAGYFNGDATWNNVFDHGFYIGQVNFRPIELFPDVDAEKWNGNYRVYFWLNDRFHEKLGKEDETISEKTKMSNWGFGLSCDQALTDIFGIFSRFGWQRPDVLPAQTNLVSAHDNPTLEWSWSTGAQMTGKYWRREKDVLACAVGQVFPSKAWKDAAANNYCRGEGHIETYYKCQLNKCLAISPDFQVIWNPYGVSRSSQGDNDAIFVYGARMQVDF